MKKNKRLLKRFVGRERTKRKSWKKRDKTKKNKKRRMKKKRKENGMAHTHRSRCQAVPPPKKKKKKNWPVLLVDLSPVLHYCLF